MMIRDLQRIPAVRELLSLNPPDHLFHYTSADALINICRSKTLWASGIRFTNDRNEHQYPRDMAQLMLENCTNTQVKRDQFQADELDVIEQMRERIHEANNQICFVSFSSESDSLPQWRAYCPPSGGFALGIPSIQIRNVAPGQGFFLAPCIYGVGDGLLRDILNYHLERYRAARGTEGDREELVEATVRGFAQDVAQYGALLKHPSFAEEKEWRLVSEPKSIGAAQLGFHSNQRGLVSHFEFRIATAEHPYLAVEGDRSRSVVAIAGPTVDAVGAQYALQALLLQFLGPHCWHGSSGSPYRGF